MIENGKIVILYIYIHIHTRAYGENAFFEKSVRFLLIFPLLIIERVYIFYFHRETREKI